MGFVSKGLSRSYVSCTHTAEPLNAFISINWTPMSYHLNEKNENFLDTDF
jgi:hypothetical protein